MNKFEIGDKVRSTTGHDVGIVRHLGKLNNLDNGFMDNAVWSTWNRPWKGKGSKLTYLMEGELVLVKPRYRKGWIPKQGEQYWYIVDHMTKVGRRTFDGKWWFDIACVKSGNYFYTREEARIAFRKIKKVLKEK